MPELGRHKAATRFTSRCRLRTTHTFGVDTCARHREGGARFPLLNLRVEAEHFAALGVGHSSGSEPSLTSIALAERSRRNTAEVRQLLVEAAERVFSAKGFATAE